LQVNKGDFVDGEIPLSVFAATGFSAIDLCSSGLLVTYSPMGSLRLPAFSWRMSAVNFQSPRHPLLALTLRKIMHLGK
jgi:hypothetical protein